MEIAQFTQFLMKFNGLNPIFRHRIIEILKLLVFLLPAIYETSSSFAFAVVHLRDVKKSTLAMYLTIGYIMSISIHFALWIDSLAIQKLFKKIKSLVNQRKY